MPAFSDHELHQSLAAGGLAACWRLAAGQALSLRPRAAAVLRIRQGRAWVTLGERPGGLGPGDAGDHFLLPGDHLQVPAGRHLVLESLDQGALGFEWLPARSTGPVHQSLGDLCAAARLGAGALLRLARGLLASPVALFSRP